jgi:hypothetical protein
MSRECSAHGGDEKFRLGNLKGKDHTEDVGVNGMIILKLSLGK